MVYTMQLRLQTLPETPKIATCATLVFLAGDRLAKVMDGKRTLLHANHGIIVCTETVAEAFDYLYYLEKAGEITVKAMSTGRPLQLIPTNVCEQFHTEMEPPHLVKVLAQLLCATPYNSRSFGQSCLWFSVNLLTCGTMGWMSWTECLLQKYCLLA